MEANSLALLALIVSILSLIVSLVALLRDRHFIRVHSYATMDMSGKFIIKVAVRNYGKRPISIEKVLINKKVDRNNEHLYLFKFSDNGSSRIEAGQLLTSTIKSGDLGLSWIKLEEIKRFSIYVEDALGKRYKANFYGMYVS